MLTGKKGKKRKGGKAGRVGRLSRAAKQVMVAIDEERVGMDGHAGGDIVGEYDVAVEDGLAGFYGEILE